MSHWEFSVNSSYCQTMAKAEQTLLLYQRLHFVIFKIKNSMFLFVAMFLRMQVEKKLACHVGKMHLEVEKILSQIRYIGMPGEGFMLNC